MEINVKFKFNCRYLYSKKALVFVSLFFMAVMVSFPLISGVNGWEEVHVYVNNEAELREAISAATDFSNLSETTWLGSGCFIFISGGDLVLEAPLEIPSGKYICLGSNDRLVGVDGMDTIIVKSGGSLELWDRIVVTHAEGDSGRGVFVERGGVFKLYKGGIICGNSADKGGGVYNEGRFEIHTGGGVDDGCIWGNTAAQGGGVYNVGTFTLYGGWIYKNTCMDTESSVGKGGGVYNTGTFTIEYDQSMIASNTAAVGSGVYNAGTFNEKTLNKIYSLDADVNVNGNNVFNEPKGGAQIYIFAVVIAAVAVVVVVGLFFYRLKKQKQGVT